MGGSDAEIFPIHTGFVLDSLVDLLPQAGRVAWIGAPRPYVVSAVIAGIHPHLEHDFFDISASDSMERIWPREKHRTWKHAAVTHRFDINSVGWGRKMRDGGLDVLVLLRVAVFAQDHRALLSELQTFLTGGGAVIFEDCQPTSDRPEDLVYGDATCTKTNRSFSVEKLQREFTVSHERRGLTREGNWFDLYCLRGEGKMVGPG